MQSNSDVFRFFKGGKKGVQGRFMQAMRDAYQKPSANAALAIMDENLREDFFAIIGGDKDRITCNMVQEYADLFGFTLEDGFGEMNPLADDEVQEFLGLIEQEGFSRVAGADDTQMDDQKLKLDLFILLKAFANL